MHAFIAASLLSAPSGVQSLPSIARLEEDSIFLLPPLSPAPASPEDPDGSFYPHSGEVPFIVETQFDFEDPRNKSVTGRYDPSDDLSRYCYTQKQRGFAAHALQTTSMEDISEKVLLNNGFIMLAFSDAQNVQLQDQLKSGVRTNENSYLRIDSETLKG